MPSNSHDSLIFKQENYTLPELCIDLLNENGYKQFSLGCLGSMPYNNRQK